MESSTVKDQPDIHSMPYSYPLGYYNKYTEQPYSVLNDKIISNNGIQSNYEYRNFLTKNAVDIIHYNNRQLFNANEYILLLNKTNNTIQTQEMANYNTIPIAGNSEVKPIYLSLEELDSRRTVLNLPQYEVIKPGNLFPDYTPE